MSTPDRRDDMYNTFWDFLAYLEKYVAIVNVFVPMETDPARTVLLSTLIEHMSPALRADLTFVGYRNLEGDSGDWLEVVKESIKIGQDIEKQPELVRRMEELEWHFPYDELTIVQADQPVVLFDQGLQKLPEVFQGVVTALAASQVALSGREYFLFFCDVQERATDFPRYTDFDKAMLKVATGILEVGFKSGVRKGRKVQQDIEEEQTRRFLVDLFHELKMPIQAILADASNLQAEITPEWNELHEIAARNLRAAHHLSLLVDTIRMTLAGQEVPDESLTWISIEKPLEEAVNMFIGDARARGLQIQPIGTTGAQPFPMLPMYPNQLTIAFKNLIHNAIVYSLPEAGNYMPIEIVGHSTEGRHYAVDIINYGVEITQDEIEQDKLFQLKYRGERARRLAPSGSGLGLTSAQRIVKKHGGRIEVTSIPVRPPIFRNTFSVLLPIISRTREGPHEQNTVD